MSSLRVLARDWLPPAVIRRIRGVSRGAIRFEGPYATWEEANARCGGYAAQEILAKVLEATLKVKQGEEAFERDSVLFHQIEYAWPVLSGLMWAAARNRGTLNVLDFGGALGSSYFQNQKFLQALTSVRWSIVEQAHYVDAGRAYIQDEVLRFYKSIEECLAENKPNVILLSSVLQYLQLPNRVIGQLPGVGATILIVDRTSFSVCKEDRLVIQRVPASIYTASYPMWVFSKFAFMERLLANWSLVASNVGPEGFARSSNGFQFSFQGFLLELRS